MEKVDEIWEAAKRLTELKKMALIELGSLYIEFESLRKQYKALRASIEQKRIALKQIDESLKVVTEGLIKSYGITDGQVTLDFDKKEIAHESIPNNINS